MKLRYLIAAGAALAAAPAFAQDTAASAFTGPRVEARVGFDSATMNIRQIQTGTSLAGRGSFGPNPHDQKAAFGAEAGYDVQTGPLVVGAYAGVDFTRTRRTTASQYTEIKAGRNITVGARAGFAVGEGALLYLKGGYSNGQFKPRYLTAPAGVTPQANFTNYSSSRDGWHAGGGFEVTLASRVYGRVDYTYSRYKSAVLAGGTNRISFNRHIIAGGIGIRF